VLCLPCGESIDDDSFFCDMCGAAVSICAYCREPVAGKWCTRCGKQSVLGVSLGSGQLPATPSQHLPPRPKVVAGASPTGAHASGSPRLPDEEVGGNHTPRLRLRNRNVDIDIDIVDKSTLGRVAGPYSSLLGKFSRISGQHCRFEYDAVRGWLVTDLDSSHKTYYNNQIVPPHRPQAIGDGGFLKLANIEFFVSIG